MYVYSVYEIYIEIQLLLLATIVLLGFIGDWIYTPQISITSKIYIAKLFK